MPVKFVQDGSIQQPLFAAANPIDAVSSHPASEAGSHIASANDTQSVINYQLPSEQVSSSVWTQANSASLQQPPSTAETHTHQSALGWHQCFHHLLHAAVNWNSLVTGQFSDKLSCSLSRRDWSTRRNV